MHPAIVSLMLKMDHFKLVHEGIMEHVGNKLPIVTEEEFDTSEGKVFVRYYQMVQGKSIRLRWWLGYQLAPHETFCEIGLVLEDTTVVDDKRHTDVRLETLDLQHWDAEFSEYVVGGTLNDLREVFSIDKDATCASEHFLEILEMYNIFKRLAEEVLKDAKR